MRKKERKKERKKDRKKESTETKVKITKKGRRGDRIRY